MKTNRFLFIFVFLIICVYSMADDVNHSKASKNTMRLLTYNAAYCRGNYGAVSFNQEKVNALANVIKILDADVVSLQELDSACTERYRRYLLKDIKEATGIDYTLIFTAAAYYNNGKVGNGVLVKSIYPIKKIKYITLPGDNGRVMTRVDLDNLVLFATHLDVSNVENRRTSAIELNQELRYVRKPAFLAGDLNDSHRWRGGAFPILEEGGWQLSSTTQPTVQPASPDGPLSTIDYVLFHDYKNSGITFSGTAAVTSLMSENGNTIDVGQVSDHYPVYLDVEFPNTSAINRTQVDKMLSVYPSPAQNELHLQIEGEVTSVKIYSEMGILVLQDNVKDVDISSLVKGIYLVEIRIDNTIIIQQFMKD